MPAPEEETIGKLRSAEEEIGGMTQVRAERQPENAGGRDTSCVCKREIGPGSFVSLFFATSSARRVPLASSPPRVLVESCTAKRGHRRRGRFPTHGSTLGLSETPSLLTLLAQARAPEREAERHERQDEERSDSDEDSFTSGVSILAPRQLSQVEALTDSNRQ